MTTNIKCFTLLLGLIALISCKTSQVNQAPTPAAGMFKITILYPGGDDKTFDMDYYEKKHMPMVAGLLGSNLQFYEIDKGISGRTPADKLPFVAIGYFYVKDMAAYNAVIARNREAVISDKKIIPIFSRWYR